MSKRTLPFLAAVLTACPPPPLDSGDQVGRDVEIRMLFPETNPDVSYCPDITVYVAVDQLTLSPDIGGAPVLGEGHWHLLRSVGCDEVVIGESSGSYLELLGAKTLTEGTHNLVVEAVTNDHQPFTPPVRYVANIRVDNATECVGGSGG